MQLPRKFFKLTAQIIHIVVLPMFFLVFVLGYEPRTFVNMLNMSSDMFSFNLTMVLTIIFASILVMRISLYFLRHKVSHHPLWYMAWCLLEIVVMSFFVTLYIWLIFPEPGISFYEALASSFAYCFSILLYPYIVIFLLQLVEAHVKLSQRHQQSIANKIKHDSEKERIKFIDEKGTLRLTIQAPDVLYIEAAANYLHIHYMSNDIKKEFQLRNSMKSVEEQCEHTSITRCHRSFLINPDRIKVLSKDENGVLYAALDDPQSTHVPITKAYFDTISKLL